MGRTKPSKVEFEFVKEGEAVEVDEISEADYGRALTYHLGPQHEEVLLVGREARKLIVEFPNGQQSYVSPKKCKFI